MILADVNLLVQAYASDTPRHAAARAWWEGVINDGEPVALAWVTILGFIRLTTNRHVLSAPFTAAEACGHVREWLAQPTITIVHPGDRHADILFGLLEGLGTAANLTTDAHLAALTIELQAELRSTDADFARFPGLRWSNPLT